MGVGRTDFESAICRGAEADEVLFFRHCCHCCGDEIEGYGG